MTQLAGGSLSESDQGTPGYRMGAQGITGPHPPDSSSASAPGASPLFAGICTWH